MRMYLSGPMSGHPEFNYAEFNKSAKTLRGFGFDIANPAEIDHGETDETRGSKPYAEYLRAAVKLLLECEAIILMRGWELSQGAMSELYIATCLGMKIFFWDGDKQYLTTSAKDEEELLGGT